MSRPGRRAGGDGRRLQVAVTPALHGTRVQRRIPVAIILIDGASHTHRHLQSPAVADRSPARPAHRLSMSPARTSLRSASAISLQSSSIVVVASQPSSRRAFAGLPSSFCTSVGR